MLKPQMIAGGGVNDITQDPNNTIDALLGGMQPKNNLSASQRKAPEPVKVSEPISV
jgi:hypothetical protein